MQKYKILNAVDQSQAGPTNYVLRENDTNIIFYIECFDIYNKKYKSEISENIKQLQKLNLIKKLSPKERKQYDNAIEIDSRNKKECVYDFIFADYYVNKFKEMQCRTPYKKSYSFYAINYMVTDNNSIRKLDNF